MAILTGDIKLLASQVMDDVPEGGGPPTSIVIADGVSNAIFPDISELDRAGGRVNLRKLHVAVQTPDRDTYLGSNIIVAEPPADPNVSITLFSTDNTFDVRTQAASRVESYLNKGTLWGGYLFENHIVGQRSIQIFQRPDAEVPPIGRTLVLVENEGLSNQEEQYIRATAVSSVTSLFYDPATQKDYSAAVVTMSISDALRYDMVGSPASRSFTPLGNAAKLRDTVVADAGTYAGVVPLSQTAAIGNFTLNTTNVYTQLVPSAQTESPISDVRMNGLSAALVATGGPLTRALSMAFTTTTTMHVGGPMLPGSLSITRDAVTLTDKGGLLVNSTGTQVGYVDYDNGLVTLLTNVWGTSGAAHTVTFTPAAIPDLITEQLAIRVTQESRALNYVFVVSPALPRTMSISYLAQGRWYVLRDSGAGTLSGISSAYGVGTLNYTTGSVQVTLGALPDVGSAVVIQFLTDQATALSSNTELLNSGKVYAPLNTSGNLSEAPGAKSIEIGSLSVGWLLNGVPQVANDDGFGNLTGAATGTVNYTDGVVNISPNVLPPTGTTFLLDTDGTSRETVAVSIGSNNFGRTNLVPGSVSFAVRGLVTYGAVVNPLYPNIRIQLSTTTHTVNLVLTDDGVGNLRFKDFNGTMVNCGTVNYAAGTFSLTPSPALSPNARNGPYCTVTTQRETGAYVRFSGSWYVMPDYDSEFFITRSRTVVLDAASVDSATVGSTLPGPDSVSIAVTQYLARTPMVPNYTLKGVSFTLGGATNYSQLTDGTLRRDVVATTGVGTPAGNVADTLGAVFISSWPASTTPAITNWRGVIAPPSLGALAPFTTYSTVFRTASSPLRPASVSVLGTMQDGTSFNVTADTNGKINGTRVKGVVNYEYGLVELYFVNPSGPVDQNFDLSFLQIAGLTSMPLDPVLSSTLRYNAVAYSYLPLDADLLGIDPVRLPTDGRVPIFRAGGFAVVGHTGKITTTVSNAQVIDCARVRLSRVRVVGFDGGVINTGYTADLEAGTVTFTNVTGYSQPVTVEHRIEDMGVVSDVQISGEVTFTRPITHDYPLGSYLSSALVAGDLKSRVSIFFDQATWTNVWSDAVIGSAATATYNAVTYPTVVTNAGALTERWAMVFTNSTTFNVIGENVGVIATGSINANLAPLNPSTGVPYFTVPASGWGAGWATNNVLRFNTIGAMAPIWVVRTVQQGPNTGVEHAFTILSRGDVDRP